MTLSSTGKAISSGQKNARLKGETAVEADNQATSSNTDGDEQKAIIPVPLESPNKLEGEQTHPNSALRPTTSSSLEVVHTINVMGIRPIGANTMHVVDSIYQSGIRPIGSSGLVISQIYSSMGDRPIASNTIDDAENLMGFLD